MTSRTLALADSYKYSHSSQYPSTMISMYDYMESRGGTYDHIVFVGLQYYIREYLLTPITHTDLYAVQRMCQNHGVPFDFDGWERIVVHHRGYLPVHIKAVPEGTVLPVSMPCVTITSSDPLVPWVAGFVETLLMKLWYPINVATKSYYVRQMLERYGSPEWAQFAYHNFGDRGSSSVESAAIGGFAHLTQFSGTDNFNALFFAEDYYYQPTDVPAGYSVPATEHSTTTSYGPDGEEQFVYDQLISRSDVPIHAFVADSYDVFAFTHMCTRPSGRIRQLLDSRPHQTLVLRPDSGDPIDVIDRILSIISSNSPIIDHTSEKTLFKQIRVLWGDGITPDTIELILQTFTSRGYAAENFIFGSGGDLMQNHTRDTQKFAIKCSSISIRTDATLKSTITPIDIYKDPITDPGKASKRGKVTTYRHNTSGKYFVDLVGLNIENATEALLPVYANSQLLQEYSLEEVRKISKGLS